MADEKKICPLCGERKVKTATQTSDGPLYLRGNEAPRTNWLGVTVRDITRSRVYGYVCIKCGHIGFFAEKPQEFKNTELTSLD